MLRLVPELCGMSHSRDLLLFLHGVTDNRLRWEALLLDASCEAGRVSLSRWILAGVLHSARISTRSPGFCQIAWVTGKRLPLSPSSTRGRRAQVQVPSTSQWLGGVKWAETAGRGLSPHPSISRLQGENLLCLAREGWNNTQTVFTIFPNLAFLVVKLLPALSPVYMSVTGEHC